MRRHRLRPDPVSCQSCRLKKLKCSRAQPCSNCATRDIPCNFLVPPRKQIDTTSTAQSISIILDRLERLESIVLKQTISTHHHANDVPNDSRIPNEKSVHPVPTSVVISKNHQNRDQDSRLLENVGIRDNVLVCASLLDAF